MPIPDTTTRTACLFILAQTLIWYAMILIAKPFLDNYGDMVEVYAWSQHLLMGSNKHPQFLPWVAHFWFLVAPRTVASFYALAAINLCVGLAGVYALGRQVLATRTEALAAVALEALAFPYLTLADKLNMNSICLATWPWAAWAFLVAVRHPSARTRLLAGVGFGLLGAVAVLGKYYSAAALASVLVASLMPRVIGVWRGPAPWAGLVAFVFAMLPHLLWQSHHGFQSLSYIEEQGKGLNLRLLLSFGLTPVYYWIIPWSLALATLYRGPLWQRFGRSLRRTGSSDTLWYLAVLPYVMSMVLGAVGFVVMSEPWAIPIGYAFTLLWVRNADVAAERVLERCRQILRAFRWIWPGMLVTAGAFALWAAFSGVEQLYYPEAEATAAIEAEWQSVAPGQPLVWASPGNDGGRIAFYALGRVEALPDLPDILPDYYPPHPNWQAEGGVVICPLGSGRTTETDCTQKTALWAAKNSISLIPFRFAVQRKGLYFPRAEPYAFAAFFHVPQAAP